MKLRITVHGVSYEVEVEVLDPGDGFPAAASLPVAPPPGYGNGTLPPAPIAHPAPGPALAGEGEVAAPVAGTVQEVRVKVGDTIAVDQIVVVVEAMKMNTNIASPRAGRVVEVLVAPGDAVREGQALLKLA